MKKSKKILSLIVSCALAVSVNSLAYAAISKEQIEALFVESTPTKEYDAKIIIDENTVLHNASKELMGAQIELNDSKAKYWLDFDSHQVKPEFKKFADENMYDYPIFRFGGATAEHTNYARLFGPMDQRTGAVHQITGAAGQSPQHLGITEILRLINTINPDASFIPCLSMTFSTPEDSAIIASYLTHEADESEWGAMRVRDGFPEPIKIKCFELGNECDIDSGIYNPEYWPEWENNEEYAEFAEYYAGVAKAHMDAVLEVCPEATFAVLGKTHNLADPSVEAMMRPVIRELKDYFDNGSAKYITWHSYYDGVSMVDNFAHIEQIKQICNEELGPDNDVKFAATEQARWHAGKTEKGLKYTNNFASALSTAKWFNFNIYKNLATIGNYHGLQGDTNNGWALFYATENGFVNSTVGSMIREYAKGVGDRVLQHTIESENDNGMTDMTSSSMRFTCLATAEGDNQLNIIMVNEKPEYEINLDFEFANNYTLKEETVITAPNIESYNPVENIGTDVLTATVTEKNETNFAKYKMPAKSIVILKLEGNKKIPQFSEDRSGAVDTEEIEDVGEVAFEDVKYHWSKNEVTKMAELGIVTGFENNLFAPNNNMTRAEFATILSRALGLKTNLPNAYFDDISDDAWYTPYINAVFGEGLMTGKTKRSFCPEDIISIEEAAVIAVRVYKQKAYEPIVVDIDLTSAALEGNDNISDWAYNDVLYAIGSGLMKNIYHSGDGGVNVPITRAQATVLLYYMRSMAGIN